MDKYQLNLGQFIKKLEEQPQNNMITFDFVYFVPEGIHSYRGYYDQMAIGYTRKNDWPKVSEVLSFCKDAIGKYFTGYKGGDFLMTEKTPLWVANYGETGETVIVDVINAGWKSIIRTENLND